MTDEVTSLEPPEGHQEGDSSATAHDADTAISTTSAGSVRVLVIKDCRPWNTQANEEVLNELSVPYRVIDSGSLDAENLPDYDVVILPSTQSASYYDRLVNERERLSAFVDNGGVLVAHVTDYGWPCSTRWSTSFLPAGVQKENAPSSRLDRIAPDHPIVDGISDDDLDSWGASTHGHLTGLPDDARVIIGVYGDENRPTYAEYEYGQGRVLVTMQTIEWPWYRGYGTKDLLRNELEYALELETVRTVSASAATIQWIPGRNENVTQGGHPLEGGLMQVFPDDMRISGQWGEVGLKPALDSWLKGDQTQVTDDVRPGNDDQPERLEKARQKVDEKYADEFGTDSYHNYTFENEVKVSFETEDGETIDEGSVQIEFPESGTAFPPDSIISLAGRRPTITVTPDHEVNGIPIDDWHGSHQERSNRQPRYYYHDTDFEHEGVEGVRVLTVSGGYAGFVRNWAEEVSRNPVSFFNTAVFEPTLPDWMAELAYLAVPESGQFLVDFLTVVPNTYSVIDLVVLADGRRFAAVRNASAYPSLAFYLDGKRVDQRKMPYAPREAWNPYVLAFFLQSSVGVTPYQMPLLRFSRYVNGIRDWSDALAEPAEELIDLLPVDWSVSDLVPDDEWPTVGTDREGGRRISDSGAVFEDLPVEFGSKVGTVLPD